MEDESDVSIRFKSMLRRAGLGDVPMPAVVCLALICAVLVVVAAVRFWPAGAASDEFETTGGKEALQNAASAEFPADSAGASSASSGTGELSIAVDVEGAVRHPGVYELSNGARVVDAIDAAGGFAKNASHVSVNLAKKVDDGMQVYVVSKKEASRKGNSGSKVAADGVEASPKDDSGESASSEKVNINTASAEELQKLSGIGPSLSQRIIDYRESKGPFSSIEGLKEVSGIGDTRFEALKDSICI